MIRAMCQMKARELLYPTNWLYWYEISYFSNGWPLNFGYLFKGTPCIRLQSASRSLVLTVPWQMLRRQLLRKMRQMLRDKCSETFAPATFAPTTFAPTTIALPTIAPATFAPPTFAPTTIALPTIAPATFAPPTIVPPTIAPATDAPKIRHLLRRQLLRRQLLRRYCSGDICSGVNCSADNCFAEICSEHAEGMTFAPPTIIAPLKYAPKIIHAPQQYLFHRHLLCRRLNRQLNSQDCVWCLMWNYERHLKRKSFINHFAQLLGVGWLGGSWLGGSCPGVVGWGGSCPGGSWLGGSWLGGS